MKRSVREYGQLPPALAAQLSRILPSRDGRLEYRPCRVTLDDGKRIDCVYLVESAAYLVKWDVWPEDDPGKQSVPVERVVAIEESPYRLPAALATSLYKAGESGMGYCAFTVEFADGTQQTYVTGNAVDFIEPPAGLRAADAVRVMPHKGRDQGPRDVLDYIWCLYST